MSRHFDRIYCPPVSADGFEFDGETFTSNRIARASPERIHDLVNYVAPGPLLRKDGKPRVHQPPPPMDAKDDFYAAQCAHYGLEVKKTKLANKRTLKAAMRRPAGTSGPVLGLKVPQALCDLEKRLFDDFVLANEAGRIRREAEKAAEAERMREAAEERSHNDDEVQRKVELAMQKKHGPPATLASMTGSYDLHCPYVSEQWGGQREYGGDDGYRIAFAQLGAAVYGRFDLGVLEGYVKCQDVDLVERTMTLHWRGRDTGTGESDSATDNLFVLRIDPAGTVFRGTVAGSFIGECDVYGVKVSDRGPDPRADRNSYDELDEDNYERERVGRWG